MNTDLVHLLRRTPGIIQLRQHGILRTTVPPEENGRLLQMKNVNIELVIGQWVVVTKGLYKGDLALVSSTKNTGVLLLLVPCLREQKTQGQKRKHTTGRPTWMPRLFDHEEFRCRSPNSPVIRRGVNDFSIGLLDFESGLLRKQHDFHSVSLNILGITWDHHCMFTLSGHPLIKPSSMPRPFEWNFKEGDIVTLPGYLKESEANIDEWLGVLNVVTPFYAKVEAVYGFAGLNEVTRVPWRAIRKNIKLSNYVRITGRPHAGKEGWTYAMEGNIATVGTLLMQITDGSFIDGAFVEGRTEFQGIKDDASVILDREMTMIQAHINSLELTIPEVGVPGRASQPQSSPPICRELKHLWCGFRVIISKDCDPRKGEPGTIQDVWGNLDTPDSMQLDVKLDRYNPSNPFHVIRVSVGDVVLESTRKKLCADSQQGPPPRSLAELVPLPNLLASGSQTPMPTPASTPLSPAWDPMADSAPTLPEPLLPEDWSAATESLQYPLLNPLLARLEIKVVVNGGKYKNRKMEILVVQEGRGGPVVLRTKNKRSCPTVVLEPGWVTVKRPSGRANQDLPVVISGNVCGQFCRCVYCLEEDDEPSIMTVASVKHVPGLGDRLSGEIWKIPLDCLATATETEEEKAGKLLLMGSLRASYER